MRSFLSVLFIGSLTAASAMARPMPPWKSDAGVEIPTGTDANESLAGYGSPVRFTVFLGAATGFPQLANDVQESLSRGNITLYEHGVSVNPAYITSAQREALQNVWGSTGIRLTTGGGTGMAEIGCCSLLSFSDLKNFGGSLPLLANANLPDDEGGDGTVMTEASEADLELKLAAIVAQKGAPKNIAPIMRPDPVQPTKLWEASALYAPNRKLALYTGAVAIDIPPTLAMSFPDAALDNYVNEIKWALRNRIRVTLIVSPYVMGKGGCVFDSRFLENTKAFTTYLISKGAAPTEYVVESYCGEVRNTVNSPLGDHESESINQVALFLSTMPVSAPGTTVPAMPGGLSEVDAIASQMSDSKLHVAKVADQTFFSPDKNVNSIIRRMNSLGGMAYQSDVKVAIHGGALDGTVNPLDITICPNCSMLMQNALVFQATNGNGILQGSKTDAMIHVFNPTTPAPSGFTFGNMSDVRAPQVFRETGQGMSNVEGLMIRGADEMVLGLWGKNGFANLGISDDGLLEIRNPGSSADYHTGVEFAPPGADSANRPKITASNEGNTLEITSKNTIFKGNTTYRSLSGNGNAYACLDASGNLYRSMTACR